MNLRAPDLRDERVFFPGLAELFLSENKANLRPPRQDRGEKKKKNKTPQKRKRGQEKK